MKILDIIKTANTNLTRSKLRTFLTVLAVFVGAFTLTLTTGLGQGVRDFVTKQVGSVSADGMIQIFPAGSLAGGNPLEVKEYNPNDVQQNSVTGTFLTETDVEKVKSIDGINEVYRVYQTSPEYITREGQKKFKLMMRVYVNNLEIPLSAGNQPKGDNKDEMILSYNYLSPLGFSQPQDAVNQKVTVVYKSNKGQIKERQYTVVGVTVNSLVGSANQINIEEAADMFEFQFGTKDGSPAMVALTDPKISEEKLKEIKKSLRDNGYIGTTLEDQISSINSLIDLIQNVINGFAIIVILAAGIGIINTLLMAVYERTREIGLMKALGMKAGAIFSIFALEAGLIGFWGGVLGIAVGMILGYGLNAIAATSFLKDFVGFNLMSFEPLSLFYIVLGTFIAGILAGTLPAIKASRLNPIDALRYE